VNITHFDLSRNKAVLLFQVSKFVTPSKNMAGNLLSATQKLGLKCVSLGLI